jgi:hypothetical protein
MTFVGVGSTSGNRQLQLCRVCCVRVVGGVKSLQVGCGPGQRAKRIGPMASSNALQKRWIRYGGEDGQDDKRYHQLYQCDATVTVFKVNAVHRFHILTHSIDLFEFGFAGGFRSGRCLPDRFRLSIIS